MNLRINNPWVAAIAILSLTAIEITALVTKTDGAMLAAITAAIAGIAGFAVQPKNDPKEAHRGRQTNEGR